MPYTKRIAHYNSVNNLLDYIMDDEKTEGGLLVAAHNCNPATAKIEFKNNARRWKAKGSRVAYHLIQSFHPEDPITPEEANLIGIRLCEELYPNFQCVVTTHIDQHHIHNHIAINSVDLSGRKLEDRLANEKEGLYGFSKLSDELSKEYGCFVLPERKISFKKGKDYYYQYHLQTWRDAIKVDMDFAKEKSKTIDEFFEEMIALGYEVKQGKQIAIRAEGMKKFVRLYKLDEGYDEKNLKEYFGISEVNEKEVNLGLPLSVSNFNKIRLAKAQESRAALEATGKAAKNGVYSEYQKTRYQEIRRFYQLKAELECLNEYEVFSFSDLTNKIEDFRKEIKSRNLSLAREIKENKEVLERANKARDFVRLKKVYECAAYYKSIDKEYKMPQDALVYLKIKEELGINSIEEANQIISEAREIRLYINKNKMEIFELQKQMNRLDIIKEQKLVESELYIHNIKFGANRIDFQNSTDEMWCVCLPYTDEYIFIPKTQTTFNNKNEFYTMFLVDDKNYDIYKEIKNSDENEKEDRKYKTKLEKSYSIKGTDLEHYIATKKAQITQQYKTQDKERQL